MLPRITYLFRHNCDTYDVTSLQSETVAGLFKDVYCSGGGGVSPLVALEEEWPAILGSSVSYSVGGWKIDASGSL
jgi:hypothetical protein